MCLGVTVSLLFRNSSFVHGETEGVESLGWRVVEEVWREGLLNFGLSALPYRLQARPSTVEKSGGVTQELQEQPPPRLQAPLLPLLPLFKFAFFNKGLLCVFCEFVSDYFSK